MFLGPRSLEVIIIFFFKSRKTSTSGVMIGVRGRGAADRYVCFVRADMSLTGRDGVAESETNATNVIHSV